MALPLTISWVILAGGQAKRMGGIDKGLTKLNHNYLVEYVYSSLKHQGADIYISANRNISTYQQFAPVLKDDAFISFGPLSGIHTALAHLDRQWLGFVPCDCPNLPTNLVEKMQAATDEKTEIVMAHDGSRSQPAVVLLNSRVLPRLTEFLANGNKKVMQFCELSEIKYVDFSDQPDAFTNLNTLNELQSYEYQHPLAP